MRIDVTKDASRNFARASVTEMLSIVALNVPLLTVTGPGSDKASTVIFETLPDASMVPRPGWRSGPAKVKLVRLMVPFRDFTDLSASRTVSIAESRSGMSCRKITDLPEVISREGAFPQMTRPERSVSDERPPARERPVISMAFSPVDRNRPLADTGPQWSKSAGDRNVEALRRERQTGLQVADEHDLFIVNVNGKTSLVHFGDQFRGNGPDRCDHGSDLFPLFLR